MLAAGILVKYTDFMHCITGCSDTTLLNTVHGIEGILLWICEANLFLSMLYLDKLAKGNLFTLSGLS